MGFPFLTPMSGSSAGTLRLHPDIFCKFFLTAFPTSNGTELLEVAVRPLADAEGLKEGRIIGMSRIQRKGSDWKGNFQSSDVTIQFDDHDAAIRQRLRNGSVWMWFLNREAQVCALSPEGRRDGLEPTILFRGWISDAQALKGRTASITISDVLSSQMSRLNLDKKIGLLIGDEHGENLPPTSRGLMYPILGGEGTDVGLVDADGERADHGVLKVIEVAADAIVPATAPSPTPTPDDPEPPPLELFPTAVEFVGEIVAAGQGNYGEQTWFTMVAYKDGHAITPPIYSSVGVNNVGVYVDAIDVYWNQHCVDDINYLTTDICDGFWLWRWDGSAGGFDPFTKPVPDPGVNIAFLDVANYDLPGPGPYAFPGNPGQFTDFFVRFTAMPGNSWAPAPVQTLDAPDITAAAIVGSVGDVTRYYQATALSTYGETEGGNIWQADGTPAELTSTNYVDVDGTYPANATAVRIYGGTTNPPTRLLGEATLASGSFSFVHNAASESFSVPVAPPTSNTAVVTTDAWARMLVCVGAIAGITAIYGTDRTEGGPGKSVEQTAEWFGPDGELLAPGFPGWPFEDSFVEIGGIRQTVIYARGEILRSHRANEVGITVNFCGPEEIGDGTGNVIDGALPWLEWFLNEMVLKDRGAGYRTGNWFEDLERYENGEAIIETERFEFWQDQFPYKVSVMITKQMTLREILRLVCRSLGLKLCVTRRGLIRPYYISDAGDPEAGFMLRHKIEATDMDGDPMLGWKEVANRISAKYGWMDSRQDYLVKNFVVADFESIAAHIPNTDTGSDEQRGAITDEREMPFVNDPVTVTDVLTQELVRYRKRPEACTMVTDMYGLNIDIGDLVQYSHPDKVSAPADWRPTDVDGLTQGMCEEHGIEGMLRQTYIGLRDITVINTVESLNQGFFVVNDDDLAPIVTNDDDEAPIVL